MGCTGSKAAVGGDRVVDRSLDSSGGLKSNMLRTTRAALDHSYEVFDGVLGSAAMGCVVHKVQHRERHSDFACKTFSLASIKKKSEQKHVWQLLKNEVELLRTLDHPNIVRAYEVIESPEGLHLVMELCTGGDLSARIPYTESEAARAVRQMLSAILYLHSRNICHRDLKPENVLWEHSGPDAQLKLIDFGISRTFMRGVNMTERVGTCYTMAPEVLEGDYTEKADLWSIGAIAFHLIAGAPAFEAEDETVTMRRLLAVAYFWPREMKVSSEAKMFVYNLLKYDPRKRWTTEMALQSDWIKHCAESIAEINSSRKKSINVKMVNSMKQYSSYGQLKKTALMVAAYHLAPAKLAGLREQFIEYDEAKNGTISQEELMNALERQGLGKEEVATLFKGLDVDQTGKLDYLEFLAGTIGAIGDLGDDRLRETFQHMDTDGSGKISHRNLEALMGTDYQPDKVNHMFEEAGVSDNEGIDFDGFCELMRTHEEKLLEEEMGEIRAQMREINLERMEATRPEEEEEEKEKEEGKGGVTVDNAV
ncbi:unnamed protein product [Chrysoparadoxa australica]